MRKLSKDKKGVAAVSFLQVAILGLVIAIITLTIGLSVNETVTGSILTNASSSGTCGTDANTSSAGVRAPGRTCQLSSDMLDNWSCVCAAYNASVAGTTGMATFANYWAVIVIVVILAAVIALFGMFGGGVAAVAIR